ncbi:MAG: tail fiber domain-containing protein [Ferruginibacter sp.]
MKRFLLIAKFLLAGATVTLAQSVGINSTGSQPNASSILDVSSTSKGLLIPRMTAAQRIAIASPAKGLLVFQDDALSSFFYYDGNTWAPISGAAAAVAYTAGTGIDISGTVLSAKNTTALWNAGQLQGKDISTTAPLQGQVMMFNVPNNKWGPATLAAGGNTYTAGTGIDITNSVVAATNTTALWNAAQLQGKDISTTSPLNGQVMTFNVATNKWAPATSGTANLTGWSTTGNAAIDPATNFIGTTDAQPFIGKVNGQQVFRFSSTKENTIVGYQAGLVDPTGGDKNHIIGYKAGFFNSGYNNHFDGYMAGNQNTSGYSNQFIGWSAGLKNTTGTDNLFMGVSAGYSNTTKSGLHFIGNGAGFSNTTGLANHFNGFDAGENNTTGSYNHFEGNHAGFSNLSGSGNYFSGYYAGALNTGDKNYMSGINTGNSNTTGYGNTFIGNEAGMNNINGKQNVFTGADAGFNNLLGSRNVMIGTDAGKNSAGSDNIFLGNLAGANETGSQKLIISNNATTALISGDFLSHDLKLNAQTEIVGDLNGLPNLTITGGSGFQPAAIKFKSMNTQNSWNLQYLPNIGGDLDFFHNGLVNMRMEPSGDVHVNGYLTSYSDSRLKKNIQPLNKSLEKVLKLGGYTYNWKDTTKSSRQQIGLIAQEVEAQFPQLVITDKDGIKSVAYGNMVPVVIEAMKEQQITIDVLKKENDQLKKINDEQDSKIDVLMKRLDALEKNK